MWLLQARCSYGGWYRWSAKPGERRAEPDRWGFWENGHEARPIRWSSGAPPGSGRRRGFGGGIGRAVVRKRRRVARKSLAGLGDKQLIGRCCFRFVSHGAPTECRTAPL